MGTVTSVGSGNYNTGSTWDSGARPGSSDDVVIASGHTVTLVQDENANSLKSESGSTIVGGGFTITIDGQALGSAANLDGAVDAGSALNLTITTAAATVLDVYPSSGKITNLTINHASCVATLGAFTSILGNLTITAGTLDTDSSNNYALTVTGDCDVTGTLTGNASAISLGSLTINSGGTYTATSGTTTITSRLSGQFSLSNAGTFTNNDGTVLFSGAVDQHVSFTGSGNMHHCTVNKSDNDLVQRSNLTIEGDLNITTVSSHDFRGNTGTHTLDVTGDVTLSAGRFGGNTTYTANHSYGSLTINSGAEWKATSGTTTITGPTNAGWLVNQQDGGTFTHNNGELDLNAGANSGHLRVTSYDLKISMTGSNRVIWRDISGNVMTVANDLTIVQGGFDRDNLTDNLTVTGDVVIEDGGKIGDQNGGSAETGANTFGSLTINSGGIYDATSGTTTITAEKASHAWKNEGGTFTHNNGKVKIYDATGTVMGSTSVRETTFYDLEISLFANTMTCSFFDADGSNAVTILNNLDITKGEMEFSTASDTITIHGLTNISSNAEFNDNVGHDTNKIIHNGLITNKGTYNISDGTTVKMNGGIRNLGTITVK